MTASRCQTRKQTRVVRPGQDRAEQHIDLAYAITAHSAQGASETFAIALEGTEGGPETDGRF
ncbi:Multifunctional conjugation protein TraI (plasmid) [Salmonella enterica subsp. enterica]|nr:Multifunctional conjugation protein TraI [Salmonella enterica subsp. enterica]